MGFCLFHWVIYGKGYGFASGNIAKAIYTHGKNLMKFPDDHFSHRDARVEWWYIWGKLVNNVFFHCVQFNVRLDRDFYYSINSSLHNGDTDYFEHIHGAIEPLTGGMRYDKKSNQFMFLSKEFDITATPIAEPVVHGVSNREYYSIPELAIQCTIGGETTNGVGWFDHEGRGSIWPSSTRWKSSSDWDWVGAMLNDGRKIMVYKKTHNTYCAVIKNNKAAVIQDFSLVDDCLNISGELLHLVPLNKEKIFYPKVGMNYSEQPVNIFSEGEHIGFGMRERTYGQSKQKEKLDGMG